MKKKRYTCKLTKNDTTWTAEVYRNRPTKESILESTKENFESKEAADEWALAEVQVVKSKRRDDSKKDKQSQSLQRKLANRLDNMSFQEMSGEVGAIYKTVLKNNIQGLWNQIIFKKKKDESESAAKRKADEMVGANLTEQLKNAKSGKLDKVEGPMKTPFYKSIKLKRITTEVADSKKIKEN
ncbi:MAG: hypothetical protein ACI86H_001395 [bacterium]|jgi:hypothetical protein